MIGQRWVLKRRPCGVIGTDNLKLTEYPADSLGEGRIRVLNILLSIDPSQRIWMDQREQYMEPVALGEPMRGSTLGVIAETRSPRFSVGEMVIVGLGRWETVSDIDSKLARRIPYIKHLPLEAYMSVLGATGLTAWFGMNDICMPKAGETIVVSAAAGAVGSVAAQIARLRGARVIGISRTSAKCSWLVETLGLDGAIAYGVNDISSELRRLCPNGIDAVFENVGGASLDAVIEQMNNNGRIALCGLISTYNTLEPVRGPNRFDLVLMRRLCIKGFIVSDHLNRAGEAFAELIPWVTERRLHWKTHVIEGLKNAPAALAKLFTGEHDGKLLIRLRPDPDGVTA